jgi:hypothetical protein
MVKAVMPYQVFKAVVIDAINVNSHSNVDFLWNQDGLYVRSLYLMECIHFHLSKDGFTSYKCDKSEVLGMDMKNLVKAFSIIPSKISSNAMFEFTTEFINSKTKKVEISSDKVFMRVDDGNTIYALEQSQKDIDSEDLEIPETSYPAKISLPVAKLKSLINTFIKLDGVLEVAVTKDTFYLEVVDLGGCGKVAISVKSDEDIAPLQPEEEEQQDQPSSKKRKKPKIQEVEEEEYSDKVIIENTDDKTYVAFCTLHVASMLKGAGLSNRCTVHLMERCPLYISYEAPGVGWIHYYLAPSIMEEVDTDLIEQAQKKVENDKKKRASKKQKVEDKVQPDEEDEGEEGDEEETENTLSQLYDVY